jgi:hypothetical protein
MIFFKRPFEVNYGTSFVFASGDFGVESGVNMEEMWGVEAMAMLSFVFMF